VSGPDALSKYLTIARMAKFEIAKTHYEDGNYQKAFEDFERIDLLELSRENHETILYYKILAALKSAQPSLGESLIQEFIQLFPKSEFLPELSYLRAEVLMAQGQVEEASNLLIQILESFEPDSPTDELSESDEFFFWKQKAGNRLANRYYTQGDYTVALRIYQGLVGLSEAPEWRLPVIYQMSLCFEKLGMYDRAKESFTYLIEDLEAIGPGEQNRLLKQLKNNAVWRLKVVEWKERTESEAASLLNRSGGST
jgi:tetratricopeptide (TPR) repeat protein